MEALSLELSFTMRLTGGPGVSGDKALHLDTFY